VGTEEVWDNMALRLDCGKIQVAVLTRIRKATGIGLTFNVKKEIMVSAEGGSAYTKNKQRQS
jgi:hypothetical protein